MMIKDKEGLGVTTQWQAAIKSHGYEKARPRGWYFPAPCAR